MSPSFNLVTAPWICVINQHNRSETVSLFNLFNHINHYKCLAGEMPAQNLAIMRFLLAILFTVYSRYDADNQPYSWIDVDPNNQHLIYDPEDVEDINEDYIDNNNTLLKTWQDLYQMGHFTKIVNDYLISNQNRFNLFDSIHPFYQVSTKIFNKFVPTKRQIKSEDQAGNVNFKQINRTISESNNNLKLFTGLENKNQLTNAEIARWLICYQNFTGVTDKIKATPWPQDKTLKPSAGWIYHIKPTYVQGNNLFQTLMLNFNLQATSLSTMIQKPIWEQDEESFIKTHLLKGLLPNNLAELYTMPSRLIHIGQVSHPTSMTVAKLPIPNSTNAFIEPMTPWKKIKPNSTDFVPQQVYAETYRKQMWRSFEDFVPTKTENTNQNTPKIILWIQHLQSQDLLPDNFNINIHQTGLARGVNKGTSQDPLAEYDHQLNISNQILFDDQNNSWDIRIEDLVKKTNLVINQYYKFFRKDCYILRGLNSDTAQQCANNDAEQFYNTVDYPFKNWLTSLQPTDNKNTQEQIWQRQLEKLAYQAGKQALNHANNAEIRGQVDDQGNLQNIFTRYQKYIHLVHKKLHTQKEG